MSMWNYIIASTATQQDAIESTRLKVKAVISNQLRTNVRQRQRMDELENHVCELAVLSRALYVYLKSDAHFDADRFEAILADIHTADEHRHAEAAPTQAKAVAPEKPQPPAASR